APLADGLDCCGDENRVPADGPEAFYAAVASDESGQKYIALNAKPLGDFGIDRLDLLKQAAFFQMGNGERSGGGRNGPSHIVTTTVENVANDIGPGRGISSGNRKAIGGWKIIRLV